MASDDLRKTLEGDVPSFLRIAKLPHEALATKERLVVEAAGVRRILLALQSGELVPEVAQRWASFVRCGLFYVGHVPLDIEYEEAYEDAIVEAVSRLDELGDIIDGTIDEEEMAELLARLAPGTATGSPG